MAIEINNTALRKRAEGQKKAVFILSSPIPYPFAFARHFWFVIKVGEDWERWEFGQFKSAPDKKIGVFKDLMPLTMGMNRYFWKSKPRHKSYLHFSLSAEEPVTGKIIDFLRQEAADYPLRDTYRYLGPNSNTFVQWVLYHFPELDYKLPWRAVGKRYARKLKIA